MRLLGIDPGVRNGAYVVLEDGKVIHYGSWLNNSEGGTLHRSVEIISMLQLIFVMWRCEAVVTEEFFSPKGWKAGQFAAVNYQRGGFDLLFQATFGVVPMCIIHPRHLKKFITNNGGANKDEMIPTIRKMLITRDPMWLLRLNGGSNEHVLEAWGLGMMGWHLWGWQNKPALPLFQTDVLEQLKDAAWRPRCLDHAIQMPVFTKGWV